MITDVCIRISDSSPYSPADYYVAAKQNGWEKIAVLNASETTETILSCIRIHATSAKELQKELRTAAKGAIVLVDVNDNSFNRFALTQKIHFLTGLETLPKNGFDHITAKIAAEKHIGLILELAVIIDYRTRKNVLSVYADILKLQRKYGFPLVIATGAQTPLGIRSIHETVALCSLFGMSRTEVYAALHAVDTVLHPMRPVEVVE